jgi:hypothetical protein
VCGLAYARAFSGAAAWLARVHGPRPARRALRTGHGREAAQVSPHLDGCSARAQLDPLRVRLLVRLAGLGDCARSGAFALSPPALPLQASLLAGAGRGVVEAERIGRGSRCGHRVAD